MTLNLKLSVVIPAYNEADSIRTILFELHEYMQGYSGESGWEIIVVNDGSTDATAEIVSGMAASAGWLRLVDLGAHYGRGRALRAGLEAARGAIIVSLDADLSYAPYHIERLVAKLESEHADIVLASAYCNDGTVQHVPWKRLWISKLGNTVLSYMFGGGLSVLTCVVRAYRREFINRLDLHSDDKEIHLEILYKTRILNGKIVEVPADLCWRQEKLAKLQSVQPRTRRSTMKVKKTSSSHLFFALLSKPGFIFWIPGMLLITVSFLLFLFIGYAVMSDPFTETSIFQAVRSSMLHAAPSWISMLASFLLGIQFLTLGFLTNQNKRNYEELYKTLNAILKQNQKGSKD